MTRKQKDDKVKEMERFINEGVPEEAREKDCIWEAESHLNIHVIEPKQRINEKENNKSLDVVNYKNAIPVRSDDAKINAPDNIVKKETKQTSDRDK